MDNKVLNVAASPDAVPGPQLRAPQPELAASATSTQQAPDLRLIIEQDPGSGSYIYKTVDRRTGEVVQQLPRDQILRMHESDYAAGDLVRTRA